MSQRQQTLAADAPVSERQRASRGKRREAEILAAAEAIFLANGFSKTTMDEIAARAGASKATIYKFFGNKEALMATIVRRRVSDITQVTLRAVKPNQDIAEPLIEWGMQTLKLVTVPEAISLYKLILAELQWAPELGHIYLEQGPIAANKQLATFFKNATEAGRLNCTDPDQAGIMFQSLVLGDAFARRLFDQEAPDWSEAEAKKYMSEAAAMFLSYYRA